MPQPGRPNDLYHVTASENRDSISVHGLDWTRMTGRGIAGSHAPEAEGVFLARDLEEARWFAGFGHARRVDVWLVDVRDLPIDHDREGFLLCPEPIGPERLALVEVREAGRAFESREVPPAEW